MRLLETDAAVLSIPSVFDEATAQDVLETVASRGRDRTGTAVHTLRLLRLAGVLEQWHNGLLRIAEPLRQDLRARLADEDPMTFRAAAGSFAQHSQNGFGDRHALALGSRPAAVSAAILRVMAAPQDEVAGPLDVLVELVTSPSAGRHGDGTAAARQLAAFPGAPLAVARTADFLIGLDEWRAGDRKNAAERFARVAGGARDRQEAIARHLLGVHAAAQGDSSGALDDLRTAVDLLRALRDRVGLAQTLTTLGRVLRVASSSDLRHIASQEERLTQAVAALEEAAKIGNEVHNGELEGRALSQLARIEQDHGSVDTAIELAQDALVLLHRAEDVMEVQLLLGGLFRDARMDDRAGEALDIAANLAARSGKADYALARVLNIQASADRRAGRTDAAIGRARRSLEIGELLEDRRHTAHAMHTLAAALVDRGQAEDHSEAGRLLAASSRILVALGDQRGAERVAKTTSRLSRA